MPENTTTQAPAPIEKAKEQKKELTLREFMTSPIRMERFSELLGRRDAQFFVNSVLMTVAFNQDLQGCTHESVFRAAVRAATLELSCDEGLHQAQIVPYNNRKTGKKEAKMIPHYLGIINLAQRTGKYRLINYGPITENMTITQDPLTGIHTIVGRPEKGSKTVGYFAYYEMNNGFRKSEYMTVEEIHAHAMQFAPSYHSEYSKWKDPKILPFLEQKTVIRRLMKSADLSGKAGQALASVLQEDEEGEEPVGDFVDVKAKEPAEAVGSKQQPEAPPPWDEEEMPPEEISRPLTPPTLRAWLRAKREGTCYQPKPVDRGFIAGLMQKVFAPDKDSEKIYHSCLHYLWGKASSKELDGPEIRVTLDWLNPSKDDGGEYFIDDLSATELRSVWAAELLEKGQGTLPGMGEGGQNASPGG